MNWALRPRETRRTSVECQARKRQELSAQLSRCRSNDDTGNDMNAASLLIGPRTKQASNGIKGTSVQVTVRRQLSNAGFIPVAAASRGRAESL